MKSNIKYKLEYIDTEEDFVNGTYLKEVTPKEFQRFYVRLVEQNKNPIIHIQIDTTNGLEN